jgi:hypothetical protein
VSRKQAWRHQKVDVDSIKLPAFFGDPRDRYIPTLLRVRRVLVRTTRITAAMRALFNLCLQEFRKHGSDITPKTIKELIRATANIAEALKFPEASIARIKVRLSDDIAWWRAWADPEAQGLGNGAVPSTIAPPPGSPHWLKAELEEIEVTRHELHRTHRGPDSHTTKRIIAGERSQKELLPSSSML